VICAGDHSARISFDRNAIEGNAKGGRDSNLSPRDAG
jgi:hypothetical protein